MKAFLKSLLIAFTLIFVIVAGFVGWQNLRWQFASPLALAFYEQAIGDKPTHSFSHAEVRKFISLNAQEADILAKEGEFDCKALAVVAAQAVCYRDIIEGRCKQIWRIQLIFDKQAKISIASASIRQSCWR